MSFIAKNPIIAPEVSNNPPSPPEDTKGLFPKTDGWYSIDSEGSSKKMIDEDDGIASTSTYIIAAQNSPNKKGAIIAPSTFDTENLKCGLQQALEQIFNKEDFAVGSKILIRNGTEYGGSNINTLNNLIITKACTLEYEGLTHTQYINSSASTIDTITINTPNGGTRVSIKNFNCDHIVALGSSIIDTCYAKQDIKLVKRGTKILNSFTPKIIFSGDSTDSTVYAYNCDITDVKKTILSQNEYSDIDIDSDYPKTIDDVYLENSIEMKGIFYDKTSADSKFALESDLETHKTAETLDHPDGSVTTDKIADGAVTEGKIADGVIAVKGVQADGTDLEPDENKKVNIPLASTTDNGLISGSSNKFLGEIIEGYKNGNSTFAGNAQGKAVSMNPYGKGVYKDCITMYGNSIVRPNLLIERADYPNIIGISQFMSIGNGYDVFTGAYLSNIHQSELIFDTLSDSDVTFSYPSSTIFVGLDVDDNVLVPQRNMRYDIIFSFDGTNYVGYVGGYSL